MAITLESLHSLFSNLEVQIFSDGNSTLLYRFAHRGQMLHVEAAVADEGEYVRFVIPCFLNLYTAGDRAAMTLKILELNRFYKLLKFSCDPADGEIALSIEVPVCDGALTQQQVSVCMFLLTEDALQERDRLLTFQQTGIYPTSDDPQFTESVARILEGSDPDEKQDTVKEDCLLDLFADEDAAQ